MVLSPSLGLRRTVQWLNGDIASQISSCPFRKNFRDLKIFQEVKTWNFKMGQFNFVTDKNYKMLEGVDFFKSLFLLLLLFCRVFCLFFEFFLVLVLFGDFCILKEYIFWNSYPNCLYQTLRLLKSISIKTGENLTIFC